MNKLEFSKLNKKEDMILVFNQLKDDYRQLFVINDDLQSKIDKAIEYIEKNILDNKIEKVDWDYDECYYSDMPVDRIKPLINILKEVENVENN